jgi:ATP adenylyltransferase
MEHFFNFSKLHYVQKKKREGCVLCLIRDKSPEVENLLVYQNILVGISLNLYPYNPGHLMIFPLRHVKDIRELETPERKALNDALDKALTVLDGLYKPKAYNIGFNMGFEAGASIEHIHQHIIPRYPNEIGIAELMGGKRVLVEDPFTSLAGLREAFAALL